MRTHKEPKKVQVSIFSILAAVLLIFSATCIGTYRYTLGVWCALAYSIYSFWCGIKEESYTAMFMSVVVFCLSLRYLIGV